MGFVFEDMLVAAIRDARTSVLARAAEKAAQDTEHDMKIQDGVSAIMRGGQLPSETDQRANQYGGSNAAYDVRSKRLVADVMSGRTTAEKIRAERREGSKP